ncbi:MAG TPA: 4-vinyl reductase, partial [Thermoplasmata archaeon]|nr:4-vinyl reductase [Thermoplasmata archaeon]
HRVEVGETEAAGEFGRLIHERLKNDPATGFNHYAGSVEPVVIILSARVRDFLESLESIMGYQPARGITRQVGFNSGVEAARLVMRGLKLDPLAAFLAYPSLIAGAGWGRAILEYDDETRLIRLHYPNGTAISVGLKARRENPACAYSEGQLAGWVDATLGATEEIAETRCVGMGDPACVFETRGGGPVP